MKTRWGALPAFMVVLAISAAALAADQTYPIKLTRPFKIGDQYDTHISVDQTQSTTITPATGAVQSTTDSLKGEITGHVKVNQVDKTGEAVGLVVTVKKFTDADGKDLVESGKDIEIQRGAKEVTAKLVGGGELSDVANKLLSELFPSHSEDEPADDAIFGTTESRKIGDSWPINSEVAAKSLAGIGISITPKDLTGKVTLKSIGNAGGAPALHIEGIMDAKGVKPTSLNPAVTIDSCDCHAEYSGDFPVDQSTPVATSTVKMSADLHMSPVGSPVKIAVKMRQTLTESITPTQK